MNNPLIKPTNSDKVVIPINSKRGKIMQLGLSNITIGMLHRLMTEDFSNEGLIKHIQQQYPLDKTTGMMMIEKGNIATLLVHADKFEGLDSEVLSLIIRKISNLGKTQNNPELLSQEFAVYFEKALAYFNLDPKTINVQMGNLIRLLNGNINVRSIVKNKIPVDIRMILINILLYSNEDIFNNVFLDFLGTNGNSNPNDKECEKYARKLRILIADGLYKKEGLLRNHGLIGNEALTLHCHNLLDFILTRKNHNSFESLKLLISNVLNTNIGKTSGSSGGFIIE